MASIAGEPLRVDVREVGSAVVVAIHGSAGVDGAGRIRDTLEGLADRQPAAIVLDLEGVDFIGSTGLSAIIGAHLRLRRHLGEIRLVNPQPAVRGVLETTRLTKLFGIFPTVEAAIGS